MVQPVAEAFGSLTDVRGGVVISEVALRHGLLPARCSGASRSSGPGVASRSRPMRPRSRRSSRPNLSARCRRCRRIAGIRDAVEATGARLVYLPPYSPDLNPSLPTEARWRLATTLGFPPDDDPLAAARADDFISEVTTALGSLSAAAQRGALEIKISRGPREKRELKDAAVLLAEIYQEFTGSRPTISYNEKEGRRTGAFKEFADAAMKPLFDRSSYDGVLDEVCRQFRQESLK
jgi:hypothetical protein